nr:hypothetical protein [Tanacetum cinerariifolium]
LFSHLHHTCPREQIFQTHSGPGLRSDGTHTWRSWWWRCTRIPADGITTHPQKSALGVYFRV